jgi:hypothetical protein
MGRPRGQRLGKRKRGRPGALRRPASSGTHLNLVGSSDLGPVEVDNALVVASRFVAESKARAVSRATLPSNRVDDIKAVA